MNSKTLLAISIVAICSMCVAGLITFGGTDDSSADDGTINIVYSIDSECGSANPDNPSTYTSGSSPLADAVANDGYVFAGWYVRVSSGFGYTYKQITNFNEYTYRVSSVTVYAFWYYTVNVEYNLNNGTFEDAPSTITTDMVNSIGTPVYENHEFYGWSKSLKVTNRNNLLDNGLITYSANSGTLTCTAQWYYSVTYDVDDDVENTNSTKIAPNSRIILNDATREGYIFLGWYDEDGNKVSWIGGRDYTLTAKWEERVKYTITYDLDGGTLVGESVDSYYYGTACELPSATREGYYFNGWMIDGDKSQRIQEITDDISGDLSLTPWWIDINDMMGHAYTLSYTMTASQGFISQTYYDTYTSYYYEYDEERGFFILRLASDNSAQSYWTNETESSYEYTYLGMQTYTLDGVDYLCEVYECNTSTYKEKQYIYNGWIPIHIDFQYTSGWVTYKGTYSLSEVFEFDTNGEVNLIGYGDAGILVSGSGTYTIGTDVTLTYTISSGYTFSGWYNESGTLLSSEKVYTFTIYADTVIYAMNDSENDYTASYGKEFNFPHVDGMSDIIWSVYNSSTGKTDTYYGELTLRIDNGGANYVRYSGILNGETYYCYYVVVSDGYSSRVFEWTADGKTYTITLDILYSDYLNYRNDTVSRSYVDTERTLAFVTSDDKYVIQVAKYIMNSTYGMTDTQRMNVLLAFVDYIEYKYDSESMGMEEYFKYPLETLYDMNGDCEDTSILFCAIASAMGYKSALLLFSGHMAAAVEITDGSVTYKNPATFTKGSITYYYCETTTTGWVVGNAPTGYTYKGQYYIYSDDQAIMAVASNYGLNDVDFEGNEAIISKAGIEASAESGNGMTLRSDDVSVDLSAETIDYLNSLEGDVKFEYSEVDLSTLSEAQVAAIGTNKAYQFSLSSNGTSISDLNGKVTISIRYQPADGESVGSVTVTYVASDGTLEVIDGATYARGYVTFTTTHFSVFMVETQPADDDSGFELYVIGMAGIVVLGLIGSLVMVAVRPKN